MAQFVVKEKGIEVCSESVISLLNALKNDKEIAMEFLAEQGITDLSPNTWHPMESSVAAQKQIFDTLGEKTLFNVGKAILETAIFPPNIDNIHASLDMLNIAYHMNHRKNGVVMFDPATGTKLDGIGNYAYTKTSENSGEVVTDNPYSCEFDRGIITCMARKFESMVQVTTDTSVECRKNGGDSSTYLITW